MSLAGTHARFRGATRLGRGVPNVWGLGGHVGAPMSIDHVGGLTRRGAARDRVGELHVPDAILERRARNLLASANRVDELLLDAPADPTLGRNRDLAQFLVAAASARQALDV